MSFNLLTSPFVRVQLLDGEERQFGIIELLKNAHLIGALSTPSCLDEFALVRLLLVVLHEVGEQEILEEPLIKSHVLETVSRNEGAFDLFDKKRPFFQDPTARDEEERPASDLFAELPSDTAINHYRHVYDSTVALCPSCCAVGLLRMPPFCTQGGKGKAPSLNAAPPVYAMPVGKSLLETLALNLPALSPVQGDRPCWSGPSQSQQLGPMEGLTWLARRVLLFPVPAEGQRCTRCGGQERNPKPRIVRRIIFAKGRTLAEAAGRNWRDPHAAHLGGDVVRPPEPVADPLAASRHSLDIARALLCSLAEVRDGSGIDAVNRAAGRTNGQPLLVSSFSVASRQAKVLDDFRISWELSGCINANSATSLLSELDWYEKTLGRFQRQARARLQRQRPASSGESLLSPSRHSEIYCHQQAGRFFRNLLVNPSATSEWRESVRSAIRDGFEGWLVPVDAPLPVAQAEIQFCRDFANLQNRAKEECRPTDLERQRQFIHRLSRLRQDALDRLKRLACDTLENNGRTFDIYADLWWPEHGHLKDRLAVMTVATLFPWLPFMTGEADVGFAVRRLAERRDRNVNRVRRQLEAILAAPLNLVAPKLLPLIRDMARLRIHLDWAYVLSDMKKWNQKEQPIQRRWAFSFLTRSRYADRDSPAAEPLAVESKS